MKFIDKIVYRIVESHIMKNNKIGVLLDKAKENERNRITNNLLENFELEKLRMQEEFAFELSEKDSEIRQLLLEIKNLEDRRLEIEDIYYKTMHRAKENVKITAVLLHHVKKIQENGIASYQAVQQILDEAEIHRSKIETEKQKEVETLKFRAKGMITE